MWSLCRFIEHLSDPVKFDDGQVRQKFEKGISRKGIREIPFRVFTEMITFAARSLKSNDYEEGIVIWCLRRAAHEQLR
jgi:hypothetical protein